MHEQVTGTATAGSAGRIRVPVAGAGAGGPVQAPASVPNGAAATVSPPRGRPGEALPGRGGNPHCAICRAGGCSRPRARGLGKPLPATIVALRASDNRARDRRCTGLSVRCCLRRAWSSSVLDLSCNGLTRPTRPRCGPRSGFAGPIGAIPTRQCYPALRYPLVLMLAVGAGLRSRQRVGAARAGRGQARGFAAH